MVVAPMKKIMTLTLFFYTLSWGEVYYFADGERVYLNKLKEQRAISNSLIEYYENQNGQKIGVKREILIKCKPNKSCQQIFKKYNLTNVENITSSIFLITVKKDDDIFELSQNLYLEDNITISHPNFIKKYEVR